MRNENIISEKKIIVRAMLNQVLCVIKTDINYVSLAQFYFNTESKCRYRKKKITNSPINIQWQYKITILLITKEFKIDLNIFQKGKTDIWICKQLIGKLTF